MEKDKLVGIAEAAKVVGVHPNTLRKWADSGLVPHLRLPSGYRRFSIAEMEAFRRQMKVDAEGKAAARNDLAAA